MGGAPAPAVSPAPPPPLDDPAAKAKRDEAAAEERRRRANGRASTILTSPLGDTSSAPSAAKTLLGL